MQGATQKMKNQEDRSVNSKLMMAYQKAYVSYHEACDRYDKLVRAYKILNVLKTEDGEGATSGNGGSGLPYTEKIMKQMIEEASKEKSLIADHARECVQHLRALKYEM